MSALSTLTDGQIDALREVLAEMFVAGFKASGEGWNGEYPFEGLPPSDERWGGVWDKAVDLTEDAISVLIDAGPARASLSDASTVA